MSGPRSGLSNSGLSLLFLLTLLTVACFLACMSSYLADLNLEEASRECLFPPEYVFAFGKSSINLVHYPPESILLACCFLNCAGIVNSNPKLIFR